ncbi:MAG: hypothetical protein JWM86_491 [Thermoleophilia bacterium]|nr:hypothetical protein [Thermoleophilia bacterium]
MRLRAWQILTLLACASWMVATLGVLASIVDDAALPTPRALAILAGCAVLAVGFGRIRFEYRRGARRLVTSPDLGFHVLIAVVAAPPWAALLGGVAALPALRRDGSRLERTFALSSRTLATGCASLAAHATFDGLVPGPRELVVAVAVAALVRATLLVVGDLLLEESRLPGSGLATLRELPATSVLALDVGLPIATVSVVAPFLGSPPLALLAVIGGQLLAWRVHRVQHDQYRSTRATGELLDAFHRYVPKHVADEILADDGTASAGAPRTGGGGEQREITVMFLDIRGFTSWSERQQPREVFAELNTLLGELADSILATDGTIDKFTGDGLMAFWGAPGHQPDHALRAVQSVPRLLMRIREFNLRREAQRSVRLDVGIGIATGPAMVGDLGHRDRLAYTAIGDVVNLAARLEQATRSFDSPALLDEGTFLALPTSLQRQLMRLDSIEVKGRRDRVRLYAPTSLMRHRTDGDEAATA